MSKNILEIKHYTKIYSDNKKAAISGLKQTVLRSKTDAMRSERT